MMVCRACRHEIPDASLTCDFCGAWLEGEDDGVVTRDAAGYAGSRARQREPDAAARDGVFTSAQATARRDLGPSKSGAARRGSAAEGQARLKTQVVDLNREHMRETRVVEVDVPQLVKRVARRKQRLEQAHQRSPDDAGEAETSPLIEEIGDDLRQFYGRMHRIDRWTVWCASGALVAAFLPWMHVRGLGLVAGVETQFGLVGAGAAIVTVLLVVARTMRRRWAVTLLTAQVVAAAFTIAAPVFCGLSMEAGAGWHLGLPLTVLGGVVTASVSLARFLRLTV